MPVKALAGCSILVFAEQSFSAHCLRTLLESAGAAVHAAARIGEALYCIDREPLSGAVLYLDADVRGPRQVVQRLTKLKLPFVMCSDRTQRCAQSGSSVLIKPILGLELVGTLQRLIAAERQSASGVAGGTTGSVRSAHYSTDSGFTARSTRGGT